MVARRRDNLTLRRDHSASVCFFLVSSLSPLTPSSDSHHSPSPRKATPPHTPADSTHHLESDAVPSSVSPEVQRAAFPEVSPSRLGRLKPGRTSASACFQSPGPAHFIGHQRPSLQSPASQKAGPADAALQGGSEEQHGGSGGRR